MNDETNRQEAVAHPGNECENTCEVARTANDCISRQAAIDGKISIQRTNGVEVYSDEAVPVEYLMMLPPAQPQYEELTPEEAASEIASGSTMSAWYWLDDMIRLKQMGYAICKEKK